MDGVTPIDEKSVKTMSDMLSSKNMEKIFWVGVKKIQEDVKTWQEKKKADNADKPALVEKYNKIAGAILSITIGHNMAPGDAKHSVITDEASKIGYA